MRFVETATQSEKLFKSIIDSNLISDLTGKDPAEMAELFTYDNGGREIRDIFVIQAQNDPLNFDAIYTSVGTILARKFNEKWNSYATIITNGGFVPNELKTIREDTDKDVTDRVTAFDSDDFLDDTKETTKGGLVRTESESSALSMDAYKTFQALIFDDIRREILKVVI
ncbi:UNVERIFIED_CONTAM: hypothetical protein RF648_20170 [Kocuria sp. CPCC 205274]